MALEQLQTWQDYGSNTMYIKQTAVPLFANQRYEILPGRKVVIKGVLDRSNAGYIPFILYTRGRYLLDLLQ